MKEKTAAEQKEEKAKEKVKTNFDVVKEKLMPEAKDAIQLVNVKLLSREKRSEASWALYKVKTPCALCWKYHAEDPCFGMDCIHYAFPLNNCRNNILKWLELPAGAPVPKNWE